ncbi:beta-glucosidase [Geosmithia morbida]|uniref:Beta-glucosidase cel3A n=1 Tax=Geosmithia morbida TaxID=1094350 RepID=A0A9P5D3F1_9HYPO|nr:beta-glucosidase [Geosmithia morbida]KAF4124877.1 beta-glucosidase [Geosmithia morbida]
MSPIASPNHVGGSTLLLLLLVFIGPAIAACASPLPVYENAIQPPKDRRTWNEAYARAKVLVDQMTLEEKINITRGFETDTTCAGMTGTVPRLQWPGMCLHDAGNGVRATDLVSSFPSGLHVGASWDKDLAYQRAWYMGREFKAKGVNVILGPNAGPLGRSPLGGRNWEGFSVDPYLSGKLNAQSVRGHQDAGVIATIKHFIGNEQETYRRPYFGVEAVSSNIDDRTLHEYYLWPFVESLRVGVASVMCSYQRVNGTYACDDDHTLNGILKGELGFQGFVMLDWNAIHQTSSANAGLDMVMPLGGSFGQNLTDYVSNGTITEERVTDMAKRILAAWYLVGQDRNNFPTPGIGMANLTLPHDKIDARDPKSRHSTLQGAIAGHVLVKNVNSTLPFKTAPVMISVYGYDAVPPPTKNIDKLFELGYTSSQEMGPAELGTEQHFDQAARGGTIITGGRAGANGPPYILDPLSAIQYKASETGAWVNWDVESGDPDVNGASDVCLVFINAIATEGWDRDGLHDDFSDGLILNVASKCANTVVVIHAAGARLVDQWIEHPNVTATIIAHLPGQDSGPALVKLLYGEAEFSGRLPYTVARNESDYGQVLEPCGRGPPNASDPQCDFDEGSYIDYRAFDAKGIQPRFEFGFGLSYTTFGYSGLGLSLKKLSAGSLDDEEAKWAAGAVVSATVTNKGPRSGYEVVQLYVSIPDSPPRQLRGFEKVWLKPGAKTTVHLTLNRLDLAVWDVSEQKWTVQEGEYEVFVGSSSRDLSLSKKFDIAGKQR